MGQKQINCCVKTVSLDEGEISKNTQEKNYEHFDNVKGTQKNLIPETNECYSTNPTRQKREQNLENDLQQITVIIPEETKEKSVIQIQKVYRGQKLRGNFEKIKPSLIKEQKEFLQKSLSNFPTIATLKETPNSIEPVIEEVNFEKEKWKSYYPHNSDFFEPQFGKVFDNKLLISKNGENEETLYKGSVNLENKKHGYGVLVTKDAVKYGTWQNDKFTGWNKEKFNNGAVLEGKYVDGKLNGKGIYMNKSGDLYEGDFENGYKNGKGIEKTQEAEYEGDFHLNKIEGKGRLSYKDTGEYYEGEFKDNNFTGMGTFKWNNGEVYEGSFLNGKFHGKGKYTYPDGQVYEGDYVNGKKEGFGKLTFASGKIYEGPFLNGLQHGIGKYTKQGKTVSVLYENGKFVKVVNNKQ